VQIGGFSLATMSATPTSVGTPSKNPYRLPGIEREGIAQLSLLETALWPLSGKLASSVFETSYSYMTRCRQRPLLAYRMESGVLPLLPRDRRQSAVRPRPVSVADARVTAFVSQTQRPLLEIEASFSERR
jgi:hypothetical protein